jgi:sec-independent protein translocase protein TatA
MAQSPISQMSLTKYDPKSIMAIARRWHIDAIMRGDEQKRGKIMNLGPTELIIILVIVLVLFGVGRIGRIGGELGSAVANFRRGLNDGKQDDKAKTDDEAKA